MRTEEQIKKEVISYLTKTSAHTFLKPKATFKWGDAKTPGYYEYDYEDSTYFKLFQEGEKWFYVQNGSVNSLDVDQYIKYHGANSKCVISNFLFLGKKMKSVRNTKFVKSQIEAIVNPVKN
jgi:hypothetical protein